MHREQDMRYVQTWSFHDPLESQAPVPTQSQTPFLHAASFTLLQAILLLDRYIMPRSMAKVYARRQAAQIALDTPLPLTAPQLPSQEAPTPEIVLSPQHLLPPQLPSPSPSPSERAQISEASLFPQYLFPHLGSLVGGRSKQPAEQTMAAFPLNWEYGVRPNRPFENIRASRPGELPPRPPVRPGAVVVDRQIPTQYYLEQAYFFRENFGPDPFEEDAYVQPGILKIVVEVLGELLAPFGPLVKNLFSALAVLPVSLINAVLGGLRSCVWDIRRLVSAINWDVVIAMVVTSQVIRLMPGVEGEKIVTGEVEVPVYTMFVRRGDAIGSGPATSGSF